MGILSIPSGSATSASSLSSSAAEYPDSVIVLRRSSSASWFGPARGPQHHPEPLRAPQSPVVTHSRKKGSKSWKNRPSQQQKPFLLSSQGFLHQQHRGHNNPHQSIHLSSSQVVASSTPQHWLVFGGPSHRPVGNTRTSLLFVVVAGGIAFLQLAYHVNYLVERYALEYSFRTATATTTASSIKSISLIPYDAPAIHPTIGDSSRTAGTAESSVGSNNLRNQPLLEIKLTTTTTTTTTSATAAETSASESASIGAVAREEAGALARPTSQTGKTNAIPVTTTTTVTTRQLNVAAAASSSSSSLSSSSMSSTMRARPDESTGSTGTRDDSSKGEPTSSEAKGNGGASNGKMRDETMIVGAPPPALASPANESSRPYEVLFVVPGVGDANRIPTVERSLLALQSSLKKGGYNFGCHVYVWNEEILQQARDRLSKLHCDVQISEGMWTHHMSRVPSVSKANYTHVGVLLDDVDVTGIQLVDFLHLMDWSNFGVASPAFDDPIYNSMHVRYNCFFHQTDFVNIFFAVFTSDVWTCWQSSMIDTANNPLGWGMDATLHRVCGGALGVIDAYEGVHRETGTSYSQTEARRQMYQFIASRTGTDNPQRYLECAGQERPAAFEECQLYWDGTVARTSVDWQC